MKTIDARLIIPGNNDRTKFDPRALRELADSIAANGLIQPPTVRPLEGTEMFQIVAGERRVRAIALLGWPEVPCHIADKSEEEASVAMLIENVQRADLDPIDEARAYSSRMTAYGWSVDDIAQKTGLSKVRIQFRIKLLKLRDDVQGLISSGSLSIGYAQILADANLDDNFQMLAIRKLRDHANPTPAWFRRICSSILTDQAQNEMFEMPMFGGLLFDVQPQAQTVEPPHPATTAPPKFGTSARETLAGQAGFWAAAAGEWAALGKSFKKQECEAAAQALQSAMMFV